MLEKGANIESKNNGGDTALILAAQSLHAETVHLLLDKGANIEAKDQNGRTALTSAARSMCEPDGGSTVKVLLDRGANIEVQCRDLFEGGYTPLMEAAYHGNTDAVKLLLDKGANIEAKKQDGETALMLAAQSLQIRTVNLLLDRGANIEAKDQRGDTALMLAAVSASGSNRIPMLKQLLDRRANIEAKDDSGTTALSWATLEKECDVVTFLQQQAPRAVLSEYLAQFKQRPHDDAAREQVIALALSLRPPPAVPDDARQHFAKGIAFMQIKPAPSPDDIKSAEQEFIQAERLAPWWGDAYYNLARAQEAVGEFDFVLNNLSWYLKTKPSDADAQDAQSRITVIQAEKQSAARTKEQHEQELTFKYVSGGAQRFRVADTPSSWKPEKGLGPADLYGYTAPDEDPFYANIFRMSNGQLLAIVLAPVVGTCNGMFCPYTHDNVVLVDVTSDSCHRSTFDKAFSEPPTESGRLCGDYKYMVTVTSGPSGIVSVTDNNQSNVTVPLSLLYRGRASAAADWLSALDHVLEIALGYIQVTWIPATGKTGVVELNFDKNALNAAKNPNINPMSLVPSSFSIEKNQ